LPPRRLPAFHQAAVAGYGLAGLAPWQQLAQALAAPSPRPLDLWPPADAPEDAAAVNRRRAAAEQAVRQLPVAEAQSLLLTWNQSGAWQRDEVARRFVGRQLLRLLLSRGQANGEVLSAARELLGSAELPALVAGLLDPDAAPPAASAGPPESATTRLWHAAVTLADAGDEWRAAVTSLCDDPATGGVARVLLACEAARRGDADALARMLAPAPAWQSLPPGPPSFLARTLASTAPAGPARQRWQQSVARWLRQWPAEALTPAARDLAIRAGLAPADAAADEPPKGADAAAWLLHQASQALARGDPASARQWMRRATAGGGVPARPVSPARGPRSFRGPARPAGRDAGRCGGAGSRGPRRPARRA
jgi:hypothetical protein